MANEYWYFLESNVDGVNRLSVLVYLNQKGDSKRFETRRLLDYDYIKNYYRLITVDLRTQKEVDSDLK